VPKFKNTLDPVHLYRPAGEAGSRLVETGDIVEHPGAVTETEDAYVVGQGDRALAFPKSRWERLDESAPRKHDTKEKG
jgi:hypothetical protein